MASTKIPLELTAYAPDADGATLELQTTDTTVTDGSVLGKIEFKAPKEASGTDAILVGAAIEAVAEGTFAADNNATELVFKTGASEAAAEKMRLSSIGQMKISTDYNNEVAHRIQNVNTGNAAESNLYLTNADNNAAELALGVLGTGASSAGGYVQDGCYVVAGTLASGGLSLMTRSNSDIRFYTNGHTNERMRISGNNLHLNGGTDARIQLGSGGAGANSTSNDTVHIRGDGDDMKLMAAANGNHIFENNGNEAMRITSALDFRIGTSNDLSSKVGINDATNQITFTADHVNNSGFDKYVIDSSCSQNGGSYHFYNAQIRGIANKFRVAQDGNVTNTNNSYGAISDQRLKTDIADASSQWNDIKALKVRKFKLGMQPDDGFKIGVVSQELEASGMNGLVQEKDADEYHIVYNPDLKDQKVKEVKYSVLYMKAIKALQEAMTRIETLETKVKTLEGA